MKRFLIVLIVFANVMVIFAQSQKTHTVVRGESIESIAKKYNVTVESIQEINPDAKSLFFVGMKLNIPSPSANVSAPVADVVEQPLSQSTLQKETVTTNPESTQVSQIIPESTQTIQTIVENNPDYKDPGVYHKAGRRVLAFDGSFFYVTNAPKENDFCGGMHIGFGCRYYFHDNIFAEGTLGYKFTSSFGSVKALDKSIRFSSDEHDITVPIHMGAFVPTSNKFGLGFIAGPRIDIPVACKYEYDNEKQDVDLPKTHVSLEFGVDFMFKRIGVRVMYGIGLAKFDKSQCISIGWTSNI